MANKFKVFFKFCAHYHTKKVEIIGDFNDWKEGEFILEDDDGDNIWWGSIRLPSGKYQYKFLIDGKEYRMDPLNPLTAEQNGYENSLLLVGDAKYRGDFLFHPEDIDFYSEQSLYLRAVLHHIHLEKARLILLANHSMITVKGFELYRDEIYSYLLFKLTGNVYSKQLFYYFELERKDGSFAYFGKNGLSANEWEVENFEYQPDGRELFTTPDWVKEAVFYQIFPERFANGDPALNPPNISEPHEKPKSDSFYGGDLQGIAQKTGYIKVLGANTVYLNPVFEAPSPHKYDTSDYMEICRNFGNHQIFDNMVKSFDENGIRFILDGVFNHTGESFWAFEDIKKHKEKSKYLDWYFIKKFPLIEDGKANYECWWNFHSLPKLNVKNPEVKEHLMQAASHWLERGASGWRLDVPNEIEHWFWKEFRQVVKKTKNDAYIVGEIWQNGSEWLQGDEFDAVMNYRFRDGCIEFFAKQKISSEEFVKIVGSQLFDYKMQSNFAALNLLSSHDTARFLTVAKNDVRRVRMAIAFQFCYIGAPSVYYGEEIGMEGEKDPDNRRFMVWDETKWNKSLLETYKRLIRIRNANEVLRAGDLKFILAKGMVIGFERFIGDKKLYIFINNSGENVNLDITHYAGNGDFYDLFGENSIKRKRVFTLYENEFVILKKVKER